MAIFINYQIAFCSFWQFFYLLLSKPCLRFTGKYLVWLYRSLRDPEKVQNFLPKNKVLAILFGTLIGFIFPSCECGIVPIITRFLEKKVPSYTAIPFMATAPIINPVVLFATYTAFGNSWYYVLLRFVGAFLIA